jgi:hypothetical protein
MTYKHRVLHINAGFDISLQIEHKMVEYAFRIQKYERELGIEVLDFPQLGLNGLDVKDLIDNDDQLDDEEEKEKIYP